MASTAAPLYEKQVTLGLGEAVRRLIHLDRMYSAGLLDRDASTERGLLADALNQYPVHVTMDCDRDDMDDSIGIFAESARSSCCRPRDYKDQRMAPAPKEGATKKPARRATR